MDEPTKKVGHMTNNNDMVNEPKRKRGRPRKDGKPTGSRPDCETAELAKYPDPSRYVVWGVEPECLKFKRKGLAILYNPAHEGGMITLMPVTDDGGQLRWRYRFIQGFCPYRYEKIDLEPNQCATLPNILRGIADTIEGLVKDNFGGPKEAVQSTTKFLESRRTDNLGDKFKKMDVL